jgi:hypothetical protein
MAFSFGAANTDNIDAGTAITRDASKFSLFARFKLAVGGSGARVIAGYRDAAGTNINVQLYANGTALQAALSQGGTATFVSWNAGIAENVEYRVALTWDVAVPTFRIYADGDTTAKAIATPSQIGADVGGTQSFYLGNLVGSSVSLHGTLYEVGWWAGTALDATQCGAITSGSVSGVPDPTDYWPLVSDANALFGGHNGTVTGASVVAHSGSNLYGSPPSPIRRSLSLLGVS